MRVYIDGAVLKQLQYFTSKLKSREVLHHISITPVNDMLEFAATDGEKLFVYRRKKQDGEVLDKNILIKVPKVKYKGLYALSDFPDNQFMFMLSGIDENVVCSSISLNFPNYNAIIPADLETMPKAENFASFKWENIKALSEVFLEYAGMCPKAKSENSPHFWIENNGISTKLVVIMPYRLGA